MRPRTVRPDRGAVGQLTTQENTVIQNQHLNHPHDGEREQRVPRRGRLVRIVAPAATALVLLGLTAGPTWARPDAGDRVAGGGDAGQCLLERVGSQYVRCDLLTGNGVPAPAWIPER